MRGGEDTCGERRSARCAGDVEPLDCSSDGPAVLHDHVDGNTMTAQPHLDLDPKKMWTLEQLRRCPPCGSPNVLFNEITDAGRAAFIEDYKKQGPAGRPAPATA
jgi:hypothetical protein